MLRLSTLKIGGGQLQADKQDTKRVLLFLSIFWILIFLLSILNVWAIDDLYYQFYIPGKFAPFSSYSTDDGLATINILDIIPSQLNHWSVLNGRTLAHCLVQLFCGVLGQSIFAIVNATIYTYFALLIARITNVCTRDNKKFFATIILLIIIASANIMSPAFQIGYVWMGVLSITFVEIFLRNKTYKRWKTVVMFLLAILCGNAQETFGVPIALMIMIYWCRNVRSFSATQWILSIGYAIGLSFIVFAPPALARAENITISFLGSIAHLVVFMRVPYILIAIMTYYAVTRKKTLRDMIQPNQYYFIIIVASLLFRAGWLKFVNRRADSL